MRSSKKGKKSVASSQNVHITHIGGEKIGGTEILSKPIIEAIQEFQKALGVKVDIEDTFSSSIDKAFKAANFYGLTTQIREETNAVVSAIEKIGSMGGYDGGGSTPLSGNISDRDELLLNRENFADNVESQLTTQLMDALGTQTAAINSAADRIERAIISTSSKEKGVKGYGVITKTNGILSSWGKENKKGTAGSIVKNIGTKMGGKGGAAVASAGKAMSMIGKANPWMEVASAAISAAEFAIEKIAAYNKLHAENTIRQMNALNEVSVRTANANLTAWENAYKGSYEAQTASAENTLTVTQAINQTTLANVKMANTWTNWIPIWGSINKLQETNLEMEQKLQETRIQNALKELKVTQDYAARTDEYLTKVDKAVHERQLETGMSSIQTRQFADAMLEQSVALAELNHSIADVVKMQNSYAENTGRAINFSEADNTKSAAMGQIMGDDQFANIAASMEIFGMSVSQSADIMWDMYKDAGKMGLSQSKLSKNVLANIKMAEKHLFKGGVKGYVEMAKLAESMRVSMNAVAATLDKIQEGGLEDIIKTSAGLQVLGGNFAMGADPLAMAYEAYNDPQALEKRFQGMMKGMGTMDTKTGEVNFYMGDKMHLQAMAKTLGRSTEDVMNEARAVAKIGTLKQVNKNLDEEQLMGIANQAHKNNKGEWVVNTIGGKEMNVSDINSQNIDQVLADTNEDRMEQYAKESLDVEKQIASATKQINAAMGKELYGDFLKKTAEDTKATIEAHMENLNELVKTTKQVWEDTSKELKEQLSKLSSLYDDYIENRDIVNEAKKKLEAWLEKMEALNKKVEDKQAEADQLVEEFHNPNKSTQEKVVIAKQHTDTLADALDAEGDRDKEEGNRFWGVLKKAGALIIRSNVGYKDGVAFGGGHSMGVAATNIVPVNDGLAQIAKTDPNDTAIFAKTGGPFDTLFNGVFAKIDDVHNTLGAVQAGMAGGMFEKIIEPKQIDPSLKVLPNSRDVSINDAYNWTREHRGISQPQQQQQIIVKVEGTINLNANGQSFNIAQLLESDPLFARKITRIVTEQLEMNKNGGRWSKFNIPRP